jgi:UDP-N-acetylglucosamine acyltransferase
MSRQIHPSAIVYRGAELGEDVQVGPFCIVEAGVKIGARTRLQAHIYLCQGTELGADCQVHPGAVLGDLPQDLAHKGEPTGVKIGDRVVIRENVTVHRATSPAGAQTIVGAGCYLMAGSHVAHNCVLGQNVVLVNGALLAGHVQVGDRATISGNAIVHQFVRIGRLAMLSGGSRIGMDVPPYLIADGLNAVTVLNRVGLRRCPELSDEDRAQIKAAYRILYRSKLELREALKRLKAEFTSPAVAHWVEFFSQPTKRGYCRHKVARHGERESPAGEEA